MSGLISRLQKSNRLNIPLINVADSVNGVTLYNATLFPATLSMSSSWNIDLFFQVIDAISVENRVLGIHWVFSPELDLAREPRYGRVGEMYGEDPYLTSRFGVAYVKAMQALDNKGFARVAATVKHFIYGSSSGGINQAHMAGGINDFLNVYAAPFIAVFKEANPFALMPSYASYDGVPMHANIQYTLNALKTFGFNGVISSDYAGISDLFQWHRIAKNIQQAGVLGIEAGICHEIGSPDLSGMASLATMENDPSINALVTDAARRMLTLKFNTRTFEEPLPDLDAINSTLRTPAHQALNLRMSKESMVLLKNTGGILPLSNSMLSSVAVIGPMATVINAGSYAADDYYTGSTILRGIKTISSNVTYNMGCYRNNQTNYPALKKAAIAAAKDANVAILALGSSSSNIDPSNTLDRTDGEEYDHADLEFPGVQVDLLQAIIETGTPVVVVISGGQAFAMSYAATYADAIIHTFLQGEVGGDALASILTGETNPSGKLTVSIPQLSSAIPIYYNYLPSDREAKFVYPTDWEFPAINRTAQYPFGYGLSYTTFSVSNLRVTGNNTNVKGTIGISVTVTNTGQVAGQEVVQVYFAQEAPLIERPVLNLIRFSKVPLDSSASTTVTFNISVEEFGYYVNGARRVDADSYTLYVGTSSAAADLTPAQITIT